MEDAMNNMDGVKGIARKVSGCSILSRVEHLFENLSRAFFGGK
jgi:hypothetical protein